MAEPLGTSRSSRPRTALLLAVGAMTLAAACSGGGNDDRSTTSADAPRPAAGDTTDTPAETVTSTPAAEAVAYTIPPAEALEGIVGLDEAALDAARHFAGHVDLVARGVETAVWTEAEGVIALLRAQLGEIPPTSIDGLDLVITRSGSSLLGRASELTADAAIDDADRDELERLLAQLTPSQELLDELAALDDSGAVDGSSRDEPSGFRRPVSGAHPAQADACVQPTVSSFPFVDTVRVDCWRMLSHAEHRGAGSGYSRLRVVYPAGEETQAETTMEALVRSVQVSREWSDANPDTTVLVVPHAVVDDESDPVWGAAIAVSNRHCAVTVGVESALGLPYQQMIAHEQIHCLQFADFGDVLHDWYIEGGAEYFSHAIYPDAAAEREFVGVFMTQSLTAGLPTMSYQAWPWWQHLSNVSSPASVWDLHRRMSNGSPVEVLANEPGMAATFQSFTIDLTTVGVPTHGAMIEPAKAGIDLGRIDSTGDHSHTVGRFVAARLGVAYADQHLFEQTDHTTSDGVMQMAVAEERLDRSAWRGLPPDVRSSCEDDVKYIMAATTVEPDPHVVEWTIDVADEYTCDPCLGGTWILDNASFRDTIMSMGTGDMPAGMNFSMELVGPYYVRFDGNGSGNAWRNDWQIVTSGSAGGVPMQIVNTMSSIETFEYGADGERFNAWNALMLDFRSRMDMDGLPMSATVVPGEAVVNVFGVETKVGSSPDGAQGAAGGYTCDRTRLEITLDEAPGNPVGFDRTTDIPDPPLVLLPEG